MYFLFLDIGGLYLMWVQLCMKSTDYDWSINWNYKISLH